MYQVYIIDRAAFDPKKQVGEFSNVDDARARIEKELSRNPEAKYILEQTTGHVNSYGELIASLVEKN